MVAKYARPCQPFLTHLSHMAAVAAAVEGGRRGRSRVASIPLQGRLVAHFVCLPGNPHPGGQGSCLAGLLQENIPKENILVVPTALSAGVEQKLPGSKTDLLVPAQLWLHSCQHSWGPVGN